MENQAESTQAMTKIQVLREKLAAKDERIAKEKQARMELAKRIKELENPRLTRKQDAAVKIARGVAVVEWLKQRPDLEDEFQAVLSRTTKSNLVRELLGLSLLPKPHHKKADQSAPPTWDEQGRIYLVVPYNPTGPNPDKDEVKRLGATYDPTRTAWYISKGADLEKFRKWFPSSKVNEAQDEDDLL